VSFVVYVWASDVLKFTQPSKSSMALKKIIVGENRVVVSLVITVAAFITLLGRIYFAGANVLTVRQIKKGGLQIWQVLFSAKHLLGKAILSKHFLQKIEKILKSKNWV
jgi:hypothetical protein